LFRTYLSRNKPGQVSTYRQHLESLSKKLTTRDGLLRRLAVCKWGSDSKTLRTAILALIHSAAEYCAPVWCHSKPTRFVDEPIHDALRLVTRCLRPTPIDNLFVLADITPTELRQKRATLSLARRAMNREYIFHDRLLFTPTTQQRELKSRHPFVPTALKLLKDRDKSNITAAFWADHKWNIEWQKNIFRLHTFIPSPGPSPPEMTLLRPSWVRLNHLHTGVWCWTVPLNNIQMGLGDALGKLQMRSRGANGRSHTSFLSLVPPSKWDTWFGGPR